MQQHASRSARTGARGAGLPESGHEDRIAETLSDATTGPSTTRLDFTPACSDLADHVTDLRYLGTVVELVKDDLLRQKHPQGLAGLPDTYQCLLLTQDQIDLFIWLTGKIEETGRQAARAYDALEEMIASQGIVARGRPR